MIRWQVGVEITRSYIKRKGVIMIKITDKAFRYTSSYNTDLKKKFRKLELEGRAAAAGSKVSESAVVNSVVPMVALRSVSKA